MNNKVGTYIYIFTIIFVLILDDIVLRVLKKCRNIILLIHKFDTIRASDEDV